MHTHFFEVTSHSQTRKLSRRVVLTAAVIVACLCPNLAFGQTNSIWNGGTGNWSTATDWTPNQVPNNGGGNTYNVTIDSGGTDTVTLDQNATIVSLVLGGAVGTSTLQNLSGTAEILNITGPLTINGAGTLIFNNGSSLTAGGNSSNAGLILLQNGSTMTISGNLMNSGPVTSDGSQGTLTVIGNLTSTGGGFNLSTLTVSGNLTASGTEEVSAIKLTVSGNMTTPGDGAASTLTVSGTFTNTNDGRQNFEVASADVGMMVNNGTLLIGGLVPIYSASNEMTIGASSINSGTIMLYASNNYVWDSTITGATPNVVLTNEKTIEGGGNIGDGSMGLVNSSTGEILASSTTPLVIDVSSAEFQNNGKVQVNKGATLSITGASNSFLNFNSSDDTLTGGTYSVAGTLQFDNANIVTNAANITLTGTTSVIEDQHSNNALTNFATNASAGSFTLTGDRNFTTAAAFANAGKLTISSGSTFTVGGMDSYTQTAGATTVSGTLDSGSVNVSGGSVLDKGTMTTGSYTQTAGTLTVSGALTASSAGGVTVSGGSVLDTGTINAANYKQTAGTTTVNGKLVASAVNVSGGSVFGVGTITGSIDLTGGLLSPGAASKKAGELTVSGTYAQSGAGTFDVDLGGTTEETQYDVLDITSTATLGGVLNVDLISGFKPTVGETFDIMDYTSETGTFATLNLPKLTGGDTWAIRYNATDLVLTVDVPAAAQGAVSASPAKRVSRGLTAGAAASTYEPVAILSRVTCFAARLLGSGTCGMESIASDANHGDLHFASVVAGSGMVHNNVMVTTPSITAARGAALPESSASATAMARSYVCSYLPTSVAHAMGCS